MQAYEIIDNELNRSVGILLYYEKDKSWIIELSDDLDEWSAPLLLTALVRKKIFTIPREISRMWVQERIIPPGRQNIGSILNTHHLPEYDEMKFLELSEGRCSQDHLSIHRISELPPFVKKRRQENLTDITLCSDSSLLCFFCNGIIRKVFLNDLPDDDGSITKILRHYDLYQSGRLLPDGYGVTFNNAIDIMAAQLYRSGIVIPLKKEDFTSFLTTTIADTSAACDLLECSRQNIAYMVNSGQLEPVLKDVKGNLYTVGALLKPRW